jgi:hypothetical protein
MVEFLKRSFDPKNFREFAETCFMGKDGRYYMAFFFFSKVVDNISKLTELNLKEFLKHIILVPLDEAHIMMKNNEFGDIYRFTINHLNALETVVVVYNSSSDLNDA